MKRRFILLLIIKLILEMLFRIYRSQTQVEIYVSDASR